MRDKQAVPEQYEDEGGLGLFVKLRIAVGVLALATLVLFLLQNLQEIDVHFLWFDWSTRMLWALLASAAFGGIAAIIFGTFVGRSKRED